MILSLKFGFGHNAIAVIIFWLLCWSVEAEQTVYRSVDGNFYCIVDSADGPSFEKVTVIDLTGDSPTPVPPTNPTSVLEKLAYEKALEVSEYVGRLDDASELAVFYSGLADAVEGGQVKLNKLKEASDIVFDAAISNTHQEHWKAWRQETSGYVNDNLDVRDVAVIVKALKEISRGVGKIDNRLTQEQWKRLLDIFINIILPLLLNLGKS